MLILPALITFSATVVTAIAVKKHHHAILHYELDAVAYRSVPPSTFLLSTTKATSATKCSHVCNKNADCKYFSYYEMLADEETYCSYYKNAYPFGKLNTKERLIRGFRGYQKIVHHVKPAHGHKNGTSHDAHKTSSHHSAPTGTVIIVTPSATSAHSHEKGGASHGSTTTTHHSGDSSSETKKHVKSSESGESKGHGPRMGFIAPVDKRFAIPVVEEREASPRHCGLKCWSTRVARGVNAWNA